MYFFTFLFDVIFPIPIDNLKKLDACTWFCQGIRFFYLIFVLQILKPHLVPSYYATVLMWILTSSQWPETMVAKLSSMFPARMEFRVVPTRIWLPTPSQNKLYKMTLHDYVKLKLKSRFKSWKVFFILFFILLYNQ